VIGDVAKKSNYDIIFFTYSNGINTIQDSIQIKNNKFSIKGSIDAPTVITLYNNSELIDDGQSAIGFFIEPSYTTYITINPQNMLNSEIFGGTTQKEYELMQKRLSSLNFKEITNQLNHFSSEKEKTTNSIELSFISSKIDSLSYEYKKLKLESVQIRIEFIRENPSSYVSANALQNILKQSEGLQIIDRIQSLYNNLNEKIKNSTVGTQIKQELQYFYGSKVGAYAPDFSLIDQNGEILKLSSLKGKFVLLDFWASWCAPCIEEFPHLKTIYKNNSDNLEIIGISRDENTEKWKNAIQKYELGLWKQLSLKENENTELEKQYFVNAIPVKVLINSDGIIIGKWRGGGAENMRELENLLKQIKNE
jgi:peroxiredoxin